MTVESASYINQLNSSYPTAGDNISEGDDHLRLVKSVLKTQFPNIGNAAVNPTATQFNKLGFEPGTVVMWASVSAPTTQTISGINDWLLCNGSAYSTTTYAVLYGVVGTTFGTSGSDFLVPDFRAHYPVGVGSGFVLGTSGTASAASGTGTLNFVPINFLIKT